MLSVCFAGLTGRRSSSLGYGGSSFCSSKYRDQSLFCSFTDGNVIGMNKALAERASDGMASWSIMTLEDEHQYPFGCAGASKHPPGSPFQGDFVAHHTQG